MVRDYRSQCEHCATEESGSIASKIRGGQQLVIGLAVVRPKMGISSRTIMDRGIGSSVLVDSSFYVELGVVDAERDL